MTILSVYLLSSFGIVSLPYFTDFPLSMQLNLSVLFWRSPVTGIKFKIDKQ